MYTFIDKQDQYLQTVIMTVILTTAPLGLFC